MKRYENFLFDWDGCLAKTLEVWLESCKAVLSKRGVSIPDQEIARHFGDWEIGKHFGLEDYVAFNLETVALARESLKEVELYDGTRELLDSLRSSKKLALISSASKDILMNGLKHNKIESYFDVILSGEDVKKHKPDPEVVNNALKTLGGDCAVSVMVGDSRKDLGAANNAGIDSILVYPPSHRLFYNFDELQKLRPTYTVSSLSEIKDFLT